MAHADLGHRALEGRLRGGGAGSALQQVLGVAQREPDRDEALLGAVVQVALQATALLVGDRHDPGTRAPHLVELAAELDPQPGDLDGQGGDLHHVGRQRPPPTCRRRSVADDVSHHDATAAHRDASSSVGAISGSDGGGRAVQVDLDPAVRKLQADLEAVVVERIAQRVLDVLRFDPAPAQVFDEGQHLGPCLVASPVEAPVDDLLDAIPQRSEGHGDDQRGAGGRPCRATVDGDPDEQRARHVGQRQGQGERARRRPSG